MIKGIQSRGRWLAGIDQVENVLRRNIGVHRHLLGVGWVVDRTGSQGRNENWRRSTRGNGFFRIKIMMTGDGSVGRA